MVDVRSVGRVVVADLREISVGAFGVIGVTLNFEADKEGREKFLWWDRRWIKCCFFGAALVVQ